MSSILTLINVLISYDKSSYLTLYNHAYLLQSLPNSFNNSINCSIHLNYLRNYTFIMISPSFIPDLCWWHASDIFLFPCGGTQSTPSQLTHPFNSIIILYYLYYFIFHNYRFMSQFYTGTCKTYISIISSIQSISINHTCSNSPIYHNCGN